jgi:2-dehydro-3-deoxygluconokinase
LGRRAASDLAAAGVSLDWVEWLAGGRMGTFFVEQGTGARPTEVFYDRSGSAFAERARWPSGALDGARFGVLSGVTVAISSCARAAALAMVQECRSADVPLCLDVNYRARLWSASAAREMLAPLLSMATIVICSGRDAQRLFDADPDDPLALRDQWAPSASICVITQSERGAIASGPDGVRWAPAIATAMTDRLGLGDAFVAGLLFGLLQDWGLQAALEAGSALAALKATVAGDFSLSRRTDLEAALARTDLTEVQR